MAPPADPPQPAVARVDGAAQSSEIPAPADATGAELAVAVASLKREVAERTRAEEALRMSEARLAGIVQTALDCIISVDAQRRIIVFNAAAERTFGWPAAEALGKPLDELLPERFRAAHQGHLDRFASAPPAAPALAKSRRVQGRRRNGEEFPADAYISLAEGAGGQVLTVTLRDLTEALRLEAERQSLSDQLRHAQRLDAVGTLAGGIAHDFNNLLGAIFGHLDLAERRLETGRGAAEDLREIRKASQRARELVQQILTFSRKASRAAQVVSVTDAVAEVTKLLRATVPAQVRLTTRFGERAVGVLADPAELHQVVMNLCTNAWHAIGARAGTVEVGVDEVDWDEALGRAHAKLRPGRYVRLSVTDDGAGMDQATQERIFEPFFSTKETGQGTGLGLAVVHGIVERLGGSIAVESQPGKGTSFHLYLPAAGEPLPSPPPQRRPAPRGNGQVVLFVDDEPALVRAYARVLRGAGFEVTTAGGGAAAIALLEQSPEAFDLLLTDYNMPQVSGFEVARAAARLVPALPVLLSSGYITDEVRQGAEGLGIRDLLAKPFATEELIAAVLRALGGRPARAARTARVDR